MNSKMLHMVTFVLLVVGGLNWLLVGAFQFNLVETIFGVGTIANVVYILVGVSAILEFVNHKKNCTKCSA